MLIRGNEFVSKFYMLHRNLPLLCSMHNLILSPFTVVIVGDSGVGKSNIMSRFTNDTFEESSKTTIGVAFATKNMAVETSTDSTKDCKKQVKLQVWDTGTPLPHHHYAPSKISSTSPISRFFTSAGQERYRALSSAYAILTS